MLYWPLGVCFSRRFGCAGPSPPPSHSAEWQPGREPCTHVTHNYTTALLKCQFRLVRMSWLTFDNSSWDNSSPYSVYTGGLLADTSPNQRWIITDSNVIFIGEANLRKGRQCQHFVKVNNFLRTLFRTENYVYSCRAGDTTLYITILILYHDPLFWYIVYIMLTFYQHWRDTVHLMLKFST